jgi:branched-chain amino acid transport system substrate-binding protein
MPVESVFRVLIRGRVLLPSLALCAVASMWSCTATRFPARPPSKPPTEEVDSLFSQLGRAFDQGNYAQSQLLARRLLQADPQYSRADEAYFIGAKFALSPRRDDALLIIADSYANLGRFYESADAYSRLLAAPVGDDVRDHCLAALHDLAQQRLSASELERLIKAYPASPLAAELSLGVAKREFARGNYDQAYALLAELLYQFPEHKRAPEVRELLKLSAARRNDPARSSDYVEPYKIGVLLPLTGSLSRFGRYFEQGATLAVEDFNATSGIPVSFVKADTHGDPVDAVSASRKLIVEEGVIAVLGSVFSVPSMAAAIECNGWKVPVLSPLSSDQRIDEIGPWVFQTRIPKTVEVAAVVRLAIQDLLLRRFAVLAPSTDDRRLLAEYFMQEVRNRGGKIVAEQYYNEGDTDFKEQLDAIRQAAPEALFIPGSPEELLLLLPQVSFYDLQLQLLGLSNWNSDKLLRLSQRELEGAIFPRETFYGKTRETYQQFVTRYTQVYGDDVHPVADAGYFGMRLLLQGLSSGVVDREQMRAFLNAALNGNAEQQMAQAASLPMLKVTGGKVREFTAYVR